VGRHGRTFRFGLRSWALGGLAVVAALAPGPALGAFGLEDVAAKAAALAKQRFQNPVLVPDWMLRISYDQWREIRFRPEAALWRDRKLPFQVQFFHPGLFYDRSVAMNVVDASGIHPVAFSPNQFDYGASELASRVPQDLGYAGFRIHHPIKTPDYHDEVIVFLGATYFRAVGRDQGFGLSARGLAIDTALSSGEEFPYFKEFWLVRPTPTAKEIVLYALLDSPSLTGAYRFVVRPGVQTHSDVELRLFRRQDVSKLGIAPLTSMFLFGENTRQRFDDYRPEVHDSDGLLLHFDGGEWLWRPLANPRDLALSGFRMHDPRGFGLVQRDRDFDHYQDLETRPDLRPSAWAAPKGDWGSGRVELVEIPVTEEKNDNIVAYWVPEELPPLGEPLAYAYSMRWYGDDPERPPAGRSVATRHDRGTLEDAQRLVIDFEGKQLAALAPETVLRGVVSLGAATDPDELLDQQVLKNTATGGWRLVFQVRPRGGDPVELRAFLQQGQDALTETWSYRVEP
jgi:glucans biosynthesis protein